MPVAHINCDFSCTIQLSLTHLEFILQVHAMSLSHAYGNRRDYLKHFLILDKSGAMDIRNDVYFFLPVVYPMNFFPLIPELVE